MRSRLTIALTGLLALPAGATGIDIDVEIPRLKVAEYHRPYVAIWIENGDNKAVAEAVAAAGLIWHASGFGGEEEQAEVEVG